jgi:3-hydroxyacyl-CoA dehydrogenase
MDDLAFVAIDNPPVNATSAAVRAGLANAVREVEASGAKAAILSCAGRTFVAGGDISEFGSPPKDPALCDVISLIEASSVPWIAAMHGTVFGGGLEIALGCAFRVAATSTRFALPEVNLGLVPGAGGTQRLPRLVSMDLCVAMASGGAVVGAQRFHEAGGLDVIAGDDPVAAAKAFADDLPDRPAALSKRDVVSADDSAIVAEREKLHARARGPQAPLHCLDALEWVRLPFAEGGPKERALHMELRQSAESVALRAAFFGQRTVAKPSAIKGADLRNVEQVAIIGGGLMGTGIATACLLSGLSVALIEQSDEGAQKALATISANLDGAVKRGKLSAEKRAAIDDVLVATADMAATASCDVAIEAVFEDVPVKQAVFAELEKHMAEDAIFATNTSYLDPLKIFDGISGPERCIGLHFFSPAHIMKLLEVIRTPQTSSQTLATGFALARRLGKIAVLSGICDGFIGNRILAAQRRAAQYLVADGAMPFDVDAAMRDFGYAMGPFEVQDMAGHQIAWANRKANPAPAHIRGVPLADALCEAGRFGLRSDAGWHDYTEGSRKPERSALVEQMVEDHRKVEGIAARAFTRQEIVQRLLAVLANEGALIVEEGIAEDDAAVDQVQLHGYAFPRWKGGPMHHAAQNPDATNAAMTAMAEESRGSWTISRRFQS